LGVRQAVLPPQERPDLVTLRRLGFSGTDAQVLDAARKREPVLLAACCSASGMWAANAATVSASADCADGRVHFTPANLASTLHRSIESATTANVLRGVFGDEAKFSHHPPLPAGAFLGDEGAANHVRICGRHGGPGIELFVFGRSAADESFGRPATFPARQTLEASRAVARLHGLDQEKTLFVQQNPAAIDAGVFHNDVACVGHRDVLFLHERAWVNQHAVMEWVRETFRRVCGGRLRVIEVAESELPLDEAVRTYLFNSQIVDRADGTMCLVAPKDCKEDAIASMVIRWILEGDNPISGVEFVDVRQSMRNGGGPACLRLRVALSESELAAANSGVFLTRELCGRLEAWVEKHYREELRPDDLGDVKLMEESRAALDELTRMMGLGAVYPFQGAGHRV